MIMIPAVFDIALLYRNEGLFGNVIVRRGSRVEFAATHEKVAPGISANETALVIFELRAAQRAALPPVLLF